ncbi:MAG: outer membrane beta-barrel protein [Chitinophagaceae bacterium]|nr:outer membrane beta-barrel protein [Chitinophagaceae bacterium]
MKKSISLVLFSCFFLSSFSQNNIKEKLQQYYFCLFAGVTGSTIGGASDSYEGILPGYQAGAMFVYDIGVPGHYLLSGETNITSCGSKYKDDYVSGKVVLTYINLPMMVRYKTNGGLYGEVGLQPGFNWRKR